MKFQMTFYDIAKLANASLARVQLQGKGPLEQFSISILLENKNFIFAVNIKNQSHSHSAMRKI